MSDIKPNLIVVNFNDNLVQFPLNEDGTILDGQEFESDYELDDYQIIFASYDDPSKTSVELARFSYIVEEKEQPIKSLYDSNELQNFIHYILENKL